VARLPGDIDGRKFLRAIARFAWVVERQRGSHRKLVHPGRAGFIVVAFHRGVNRVIARRILREAGIDEGSSRAPSENKGEPRVRIHLVVALLLAILILWRRRRRKEKVPASRPMEPSGP